MTSNNEPIQYQIIQWLDRRLTRNIKDYTNCKIEDKCARVFSNFRLEQNKPIGIKLTRFGKCIIYRE